MTPHLILDHRSVAAAEGVTFHLNQATKHPDNPVLLPGPPHQWDSLCVCWPGTVLYSASDRRFRCWYTGMDVVQAPERTWHTGYAQSDDGIHWTKPALGQARFRDQPTNQLKPDWDPHYLSLVFENPDASAPPTKRFGGYWTESRFAPGHDGDWKKSLWRKTLAWSPDGITWTRTGTAYGEVERAAFLDISQVLHDPDEPDPAWRCKAYGQLFVPRPDASGWPGIRQIAVAHGESAECVQTDKDPVVLAPLPGPLPGAIPGPLPGAGIDEEIHFAAVQKFGRDYLMLFESDRFSRSPIHGDLRLAVSRDGRSFRRVHRESPLVATGPKGSWDENLLVTHTAGMQTIGDTVLIYYFGCPRMYDAWPSQYAVSSERRGSAFAPVYLGLATLLRDRFAYAQGPGTVTTHPLQIGDGGLWLNADGEAITAALRPPGSVETSGAIQTSAPSESSAASGAFAAFAASGVSGVSGGTMHAVYRKVEWSSSPPPRGTCQVTLTLPPGSRLYSIQC